MMRACALSLLIVVFFFFSASAQRQKGDKGREKHPHSIETLPIVFLRALTPRRKKKKERERKKKEEEEEEFAIKERRMSPMSPFSSPPLFSSLSVASSRSPNGPIQVAPLKQPSAQLSLFPREEE
jgi:hypothetical protein